MTREEREQALEWFKNRPITMSGAKKMYDLAISALEQPESCEDCINRQAAIDAIDMALDHIDHVPEWVYDRLLTALDKVPSAQPEIIRCRDCKHYYYADNRIPQEQWYSCILDGGMWEPEDFCSYAERKTE